MFYTQRLPADEPSSTRVQVVPSRPKFSAVGARVRFVHRGRH